MEGMAGCVLRISFSCQPCLSFCSRVRDGDDQGYDVFILMLNRDIQLDAN